ncbi:hypothetical protein [Dyadobacter sp. BHUBP1]|uniref:hypothetical protein n=1 Tax=Dyadobacter sp. BHUBP1 TaxID=3424178 RepID=UPI003D3340DD
MEQSRPNLTNLINDSSGNEESLADYVKRMETEGNLQKLAQKLESDLRKPGKSTVSAPDVSTRDVSTPDVSTLDLSFEKFEKKRKRRGDQ